jgi:hypothetical protein
MQIPTSPLHFIPGLLRQLQAAPGPQARSDARPAPAETPGRGRASTALRLDEAVRTLRAEGRVPPRGSLLDIQA